MKNYLSIKEVKDLPANSEFKAMGIVSHFNRRKDRNNNPFWELTIADSTGDLEGKVWPLSIWWNTQGGEKFPIDPDNCGIKFEGSSVGVYGMIGEFKDQLQYNFDSVYYLDQKEYPPQTFTRRSKLPYDFLESSFRNLIASIKYQPLQDFVNAVFFKHGIWEKFHVWPAAVSLHHAYTNGLLEHSISVAEGAIGISKHYSEFGIPVNMDLVIAGALLHDIGKTEAYSIFPSPSMTVAGNVIEHISLGYYMFMHCAELEKLEDDITMALAHIILSHHGKREYGSPAVPATPEAMIVNAADDLDFKLSYWKLQMDSIGGGAEMTDYLSLVERKLWRGIKPR